MKKKLLLFIASAMLITAPASLSSASDTVIIAEDIITAEEETDTSAADETQTIAGETDIDEETEYVQTDGEAFIMDIEEADDPADEPSAASVVASGYCGEGTHLEWITWSLDTDGTLTIARASVFSGNSVGSGYYLMESYTTNTADDYSPWYEYKSSIKTVVIEYGVENIGSYAFVGCSNLTSVSIANSVLTIGNGAFYGCSQLPSISIPESVQAINAYAFYRCESFTDITIPDGVTEIGNGAFERCSSLTCVTIPNSVISIGMGVFGGDYKLTDIYYKGSESDWNSLIKRYRSEYTDFTIHFLSSSITIEEITDTLYVGDEFAIGATLTCEESFESAVPLTWEVNNDSGLELGSSSINYLTDGKTAIVSLKAAVLKPGTYTITVTTSDGASDSITIETLIDFDIPGDEWNFRNYDVDSVPLSATDKLALFQELGYSETAYWNSIINQYHGGQCFGMAVISSLVAQDELSLSLLSSTATRLYDVPFSDTSKSVIGYYYLEQFTDTFRSAMYSFLDLSIQEQFQSIMGMTEPFVILITDQTVEDSFSYHTILGYGVEEGTWTYHGTTYSSRILIYDSNNYTPGTIDESRFLYFNSSAGTWEIPHYVDTENIYTSKNSGAYIVLASSDTELLNTFDLAKNKDTAYMLIQQVEDGTIVIDEKKITRTGIIDSSLITMASDSSSSSGNMIIADINNATEYGYVSSSGSQALEASVLYNGVYLSATADSFDSITFDVSNNMTLQGADGEFTLGITADESPIDFHEIYIEGENAETISIQLTDDGIQLAGSDLSSLTIKAADDEATETISVSTDEDSILISENTNHSLTAYVDADGNGTYETALLDDKDSGTLMQDTNGNWCYYSNGEFDTSFNGIAEFNGGSFFVANGVLCSDANGLNLYDGKWYFLAYGQVQTQYTGLALYDNEWFYIKDGVLDTTINGLIPYDREQFLVAEGHLLLSYNGLWLNAAEIGGDNNWYFIAAGMVQNVSQIVMYDGAFFVVEDGILDTSYNGTIEYNGAVFRVTNGQLYEQTA
ncbi:MAG: leucine-rich repeat domain-containing protein [Lachnospiraceae bacterium]|nr:leucine-rich repeat domain-containing protein [Lachnospiraceae bacterium]